MGTKINKENFKAFMKRRKLNFYSLLAITCLSILITAICLIVGWIPNRVSILVVVSVLLALLCCLQTYRLRKCFRTMKEFKGQRKKREREE